jgi:hypothetical protein
MATNNQALTAEAIADFYASPFYAALAIEGINDISYSPNMDTNITEEVYRLQMEGLELPAKLYPLTPQNFTQAGTAITIPITPTFSTGIIALFLAGIQVEISNSTLQDMSTTVFTLEWLNRAGTVLSEYTQTYTVSPAQFKSTVIFRPSRVVKQLDYSPAGAITIQNIPLSGPSNGKMTAAEALPTTDVYSAVSCRLQVVTALDGRKYTVTPMFASDDNMDDFLYQFLKSKNNLNKID